MSFILCSEVGAGPLELGIDVVSELPAEHRGSREFAKRIAGTGKPHCTVITSDPHGPTCLSEKLYMFIFTRATLKPMSPMTVVLLF